jgi:hypothetical protein
MTKPACMFMGFGLYGNTNPRVAYYGGQTRIVDAHQQTDEAAEASHQAFVESAIKGVQDLQNRQDCAPMAGVPVELFGYWDVNERDVVLVWRMACTDEHPKQNVH